MDRKLLFTSILLLASIIQIEAKTSLSIKNFGARSDGKTDISKALAKAWIQACASIRPSKVVIPRGVFYLSQIKLEGPCKATPITFKVEGTLKADPLKTLQGEWVTFKNIDQLIVNGGGTFDGQGNQAWIMNNCHKSKSCKSFPYNLSFNVLTNSIIGPFTTRNSKNFHANVNGCKNVTFSGYTVRAPRDSVNTDGVHLTHSTDIHIMDSDIKTGDDCVSIGDNCHQIYIQRITCGPGHGVSLGSLGKYKLDGAVTGIYIENCTLMNTDNGIRLKTWPDSFPGAVADMRVKDIQVQNVQNPIIIDQEYCPHSQCSLKAPSNVKISDVSFTNIWGTFASPNAVKITCSKKYPCKNVKLKNINLKYIGKRIAQITSTCDNVKPIISGTQNPKLCASSST